MADPTATPTPASNRRLLLTLGTAAATLVVILGVIAGPSIVSCTSGGGDLGACLRGKMADAGILPKPAAPAVPAAETPEETVAVAEPQPETPAATEETPAVEAESPPAEEAPAAAEEEAAPAGEAPAAETPAAEDTEVAAVEEPAVTPGADSNPAFSLVRTEPDGSTVIAGTGAPNGEVAVYGNGELLGTTTAEATGDWVFVPDQPLPPGGVELTVGMAGAAPSAAQSFVVVVDEDKTSEPLVVASTPGEASEILQGLTRPEPEETEIAAVEEPAAEPEAEPETPATETETPASEPEAEPGETEVAAAEPQPETPAAPQPVVQPTIDAIEIEGVRNFFAGAGQDGAVVRLYVDDAFVADATVAAGRWLIEAENVLKSPSQRVRVDQLAPGSAEVAARAEVNFVIDVPDIPDVEVATAEPPPADHTTPAEAEPTAGETSTAGASAENAPTADPAAAAEVAGAAEPATEPGPATGETEPAAAGTEPAAAGTEPATTTDTPGETPTRQMDLPATEPPAAEPAPAEDRDINATPDAEPANQPEPEVAGQTEPEASDRPAEPAARQDPAVETETEPERVAEAGPAGTEDATRPEEAAEPAPEAGAEQTPQADAEAEPVVEAEPEPVVEPAPEAPATSETEAAPEQPPAAEPVEEPEAAPEPTEAETAEAEIPTLVAEPVGDPAMQRFASGRAIIRRGDNLWTIATRVYGEGMRYTMIWNANTDQIRDPHWIYPGQVFELPTGQ